MKPELLLKDPIFQLNLLLWMAKEQPYQNYYVYPFFHELGFKILYIEHPFRFPDKTAKKMIASGLDIGVEVEPDLLLRREIDSKAVYFELKADSFSTTSSNSKQARGHLVASGSVFSEVYSPVTACLLCYVIPSEACDKMKECLLALQVELNGKGLSPGEFSSHGLSTRNSPYRIIYSWDSFFKNHVGVSTDEVTVLSNVLEDTDPTPLLLVFSDEDCYNTEMRDFYRKALIEQIRACILCDLHSQTVSMNYESTTDNILLKTSDGIFQYLGRKRQKSLMHLVRENIFKRIFEFGQTKKFDVKLNGNTLSVSWKSDREKEEFLDLLEDRRVKFDTSKPDIDGQAISLFENESL
jgi:hypothetical protein